MGDVILPALAVVATWALTGACLLGCGHLVRILLGRCLRGAFELDARLRFADVWIGLAALLAYLQIWSLFTGVSSPSLLAPAACGAAGLALGVRRLSKPRLSRWLVAELGALTASLVWLGNLGLGRPTAYDSGLYHFGAIEYARRFGVVPGLANLNERLGAGDAHFLLVAFLDHGPWTGGGFHLANGLLVALLLTDIATRLVGPRATSRAGTPFTRLTALLLVPAIAVAALSDPGGRVSSPSLDLPMFVLFAVGSLYLAESVERGFEPAAALAATAAFAAATATRPQFAPGATVAVAILVYTGRTRQGRGRAVFRLLPAAVLVATLPLAVVVGDFARQAVLSGLPLYPTELAALPVDWSLPDHVIDTANRWVASWARAPDKPPGRVLGSWDWLGGWVSRERRDIDVLAPLALAACILPVRAFRRPARARRKAMWALLAPSLVTLPPWFLLAPDPRYVYAAIWLVPIAMLARLLPSHWPDRPASRRGALVYAVGLCAAALAAASVVHGGAYRLVSADGAGPFGSRLPPAPALATFTTSTGLRLRHPIGDDRCWESLLCTPARDVSLRARGEKTADGFTDTPG
jgi:hypothetical protein